MLIVQEPVRESGRNLDSNPCSITEVLGTIMICEPSLPHGVVVRISQREDKYANIDPGPRWKDGTGIREARM